MDAGGTTAAARPDSPSRLSEAILTLGDQWNLLILQRAFQHRTQHFSEWRNALGLSESVLSDRLQELVAAEILTTTSYADSARVRNAYRLTERGRALWSLLVAIWSWEIAWVADSGWPGMRHTTCGATTTAHLGCGACGRHPVTARETSTVVRGTISAGSRRRHHRKSSRSPQGGEATYHHETLDILGDRWSILLLGTAFLGVRTFAAFKAELNIAPSVLSSRLRHYTSLGILIVVDTPGQRGHDYRLTDKGLAFFPVFALMNQWASDWLGPPGHRPELDITHRECGQRLQPVLACAACGEQLERTAIRGGVEPPAD